MRLSARGVTLLTSALLALVVLSFPHWTQWAHQGQVAREASPRRNDPGELTGETPYLWAVIGNSADRVNSEFAAGVRAKVFRLSWRSYAPGPASVDSSYIEQVKTDLEQARRSGLAIILELGFHDTPDWVHETVPDSRYINQFGEPYRANGEIDAGDANLVFNQELRGLVDAYVDDVFRIFGSNFLAVRAGGGRYGELWYPRRPSQVGDKSYWAFDPKALRQSPTRDWTPGLPSPNGEAARFLSWYLDSLVEFQSWQISTIRRHYSGRIMLLYPSWGIRPGQIDEAIAANLDGTSPAELNYEIQSGVDFARQIAAIRDPNVLITTTWLDAPTEGDASADPRLWTPTKYLAFLAGRHQIPLGLFGENTGQGSADALRRSAAQMHTFGLLGMAWYRDEELFSGTYATIDDYREVIDSYRARRLLGEL